MFKLACGLLALAGSAVAENVVTLGADNFDETVDNNEFVLVEFFAPWCGHCKHLAPEYEKAATALKEEGSDVILGAVDATEHTALGQRFEVRGYPTLKWFVSGQAQEYTGGRDEATILSWIRKKTGPPAALLDDTAAINAFTEKSKVAVVAFVDSAESAEYEAFVAHAKTDDDLTYGYSTSAEAAAAAGASIPSVVLFKQFDEGKAVMSEDISTTSVARFVKENKNPIVIEFDMNVVQEVFNSDLGKVAYLFAEADDNAHAAFKKVAEANRGSMVFVTGDKSHDRVNNYVGVEDGHFPRLVIMDTAARGNMKKFPLITEDALTEENLSDHVSSFLKGELKAHSKSEAIPAENSEPVTVVVGDSFNDIVLDEAKDVLLEVYAPWCGHCKKLAPAWDQLGEEFSGDANIVVAKMDGTLNEVDGLEASGFPTLKFYPAEAGKTAASGLAYNGGREFADLKTYLQDNRKSAPAADDHDEL